MKTPPSVQKSSQRSRLMVAWGIIAAVAGLACVVLPPLLFPGAKIHPAYGHPLIPWFAFAFANLRVVPTMSSFFVLGVAAGFSQPQSWLRLGWLAVSLPPILNAINIVRDCAIDPTDHNLFPFEFVILAFVSLPVMPGALIGSVLGFRLRPRS